MKVLLGLSTVLFSVPGFAPTLKWPVRLMCPNVGCALLD